MNIQMDAEFMAKLFHDTYEKLAPDFGYKTREASAKPWFEIPENNRKLMIAVAEKVLSVQKKQTEDDCIENCAVVDRNEQLEAENKEQQTGLNRQANIENNLLAKIKALQSQLGKATEKIELLNVLAGGWEIDAKARRTELDKAKESIRFLSQYNSDIDGLQAESRAQDE